ncbi:MAG: HepT-like ribonuclease domain-containing protein [Christensenellales bacterium]
MRHRLVHEYEGINWTMIVEIVFEDMPGFVQDVRKIIAEIEENE